MDTNESDSPSLYQFAKAVHSLRQAFAQPKSDLTRDATVYRFVYTFELAWSALCLHLGAEGVPQDVSDDMSIIGPFWLAEQQGILTEADAEAWSSYFRAWQRATHSHDVVHVEALYHMIVPDFLEDAQALLDALVDRRGPRSH